VGSVLRNAGIDERPLVALANAPEAKERLRRNTDEALGRGAFGVPTLFVEGEMFFGSDSFPDIEAFVRGEDPVAKHPGLIEQWANLPVAAARPRAG
jgi:2-hydroxychromene-2-carboxylate isomerase